MSKPCDCNFSSNIAYVVTKLTHIPKNKISVLKYVDDKKLTQEVKQNEKYLVCEYKNELILSTSIKKKKFFKHKHCEHTNVGDWHLTWQSYFDKTEVDIGSGRADAIIKNIVLEFQHSRITKSEITSRTNNYTDHKKQVLWIIDASQNVVVEKISYNNNLVYNIIFDKKSKWMYENFTINQYVYLDVNGKIYRINPTYQHITFVKIYKKKEDFVKSINDGKNEWPDDIVKKGVIYINQRGAGCGKTYESVALIYNNKMFSQKKKFVYLTKLHSARKVIVDEIKSQFNKQKIIYNDGPFEKYDFITFNDYKKQIVVATVDSFMYAIKSDSNIEGPNYFEEIVKQISNNLLKNAKELEKLKFKGKITPFGMNTLIIIDEAQDLNKLYITAMDKFIQKTHVDVYVIGDRLQSIWSDINTFTCELNDIKTLIHRSDGVNNVRRFHNSQFIDFCNNIIRFNLYHLPTIQSICDVKNCKYEYAHKSTKRPFFVYNLHRIGNNHIFDISNITKIMEKEINAHTYLPKHFMFIFPILTQNKFAHQLESMLQNYWISKFNNKEYQLKCKEVYGSFSAAINDYRYVILHKSEEGKPINMKESENATKILSIHSAKGNGCEVIFVLQLSERALKRFSGGEINLVYESLLHVALTRQKTSLYVGLEINPDDEIRKRFAKHDYINNVLDPKNKEPSLYQLFKYISSSDLQAHFISDVKAFNAIKQIIDSPKHSELKKQFKTYRTSGCDMLIDTNHHIIRRWLMFYYIMYNTIMKDTKRSFDKFTDQFFQSLRSLTRKIDDMKQITNDTISIKKYSCEKYYNELSSYHTQKYTDRNQIPIIEFGDSHTINRDKYDKYSNITHKYMNFIINKIDQCFNGKIKKIPTLCPIEIVILTYIMEIRLCGKYTNISIMDVYNILYYYDKCDKEKIKEHWHICKKRKNSTSECKCDPCSCDKLFTTHVNNNRFDKKLEDNIVAHYENVSKINEIYKKYKDLMFLRIRNYDELIYNISQHIYCSSKDFEIHNRVEIIARSDTNIVQIIISPQFNMLNIYQIIVKSIINTIIIKGDYSSSNRTKFLGKKMTVCIFTLSTDNPIIYDLDMDMCANILYEHIVEFVYKKFSTYHYVIHEYYKYHSERNDTGLSGIEYTNKLLNTESKNIPDYIIRYFQEITNKLTDLENEKNELTDEKEISICDKQISLIASKVKDIKILIDNLNIVLRRAVETHFKYMKPIDKQKKYDY